MRRTALACLLNSSILLAGLPLWAADAGYQYYVSGNPQDVDKPTSGLIVVQGGGTDVDENYRRMAEKGGGGDFLVLRASGEDQYNDYIFALCNCDSVETLVFENRAAAFEPFVVETIRNAEALFIAGGDQSRYLRFWHGTPVLEAIQQVAGKPAPIGGTSAGMAVLGEFVYSAMSDASLTAEHALSDPYHPDLTLARDFLSLPALANILTDQHLQERDRMGRTVAMLARLLADGWTNDARAIAADRETALHIDPVTGIGEVFATADHETPFVYFLRAVDAAEVCEPGQPLTLRDVAVHRAGPGDRFDLRQWSGEGGSAYVLSSVLGALESTAATAYGK